MMEKRTLEDFVSIIQPIFAEYQKHLIKFANKLSQNIKDNIGHMDEYEKAILLSMMDDYNKKIIENME